MRLTDNQLKILTALHNRNTDGSDLDLDQLLDVLAVHYDWVTSKASLQWSLRGLLKLELIERCDLIKRRGRSRRVLHLTELGVQVLGLD